MGFKSKIAANVGLVGAPTTLTNTVIVGLTHTIIGLSLANTSALNIQVSAKLNKNGGTSAFLVKDATVVPGGAEAIVGGDQKVVLEEGDSITVYSSASNACDGVVSYLEG